MARLPKPGADPGTWANLLNEYLLVAHNPDGTPRASNAKKSSLAQGSVGLSDLDTTNPVDQEIQNLFLSNDGLNLFWAQAEDLIINVKDFGAVGDGITDDTAAVQAAIDSANKGGGVVFPRGTYKITGVVIKTQGTTLLGNARQGVQLSRLSGTKPLVDISGTGSVNNHIKYCAIENMTLSGNFMPGTLLRSYYADNLIFREVSFVHTQSNAVDVIEVWDTSFEDCVWDDCGSDTEPALWLRNSAPSGTFGFGNDTTNDIHFHNCRWEGFRNGAVRIDGAANGSLNLLNTIFFVSCKMETRVIAGSVFQIMNGSTIVLVDQLYIAVMSTDIGFNTPIDAIEDHGTHVFISDVYVQWGAQTGLANSVIHFWSGNPHIYHKISSFHPSEQPATATIVVEPAAIVTITSLWTNLGNSIIGSTTNNIIGGPSFGYVFPIDNFGRFRVTSFTSGKDIITVVNNPVRNVLEAVNATDLVGFSDAYITEKWRIIGASGAVRFASGKYQIEGTKGYVGMNTSPNTSISMLIRPAAEGDRGLAIVRPSSTATNRLMEFQDETYNTQGLSIDSNGRPVAVGTPPHLTPGDQAAYANPNPQIRDIAGSITVAVKPSPTAPGVIANLTFSRPYATKPICITFTDHSVVTGDLYVSARSASGFSISTRSALRGGLILNFDYTVIA